MEKTKSAEAYLGSLAKPDRQTIRLLARLVVVLAVAILGFAGFAAYEANVLGLSPLGEMPPLFGPFQSVQAAFSLVISALIVWTIYSERAVGHGFDRDALPPLARSAASAAIGVALGSVLLFIADPALFGATAQEDHSVEWVSTLLLFGACGLFVRAALVSLGRGEKIGLLIAVVLAGLFFVMAMEEISWMQRIFGYATPQDIAQVNWQGEFNFHNVETDLFENVYYVATVLFLILLPFINDATPWLGSLGALSDFVPRRPVAAMSAGASIFNYGMWNVLPQQMTMMISLFVFAFYSRAARRRGDRGESWLFGSLAAAVVAGQAAFLTWGHLQPDIWDASEYKELFIALGLAAYAVGVTIRLKRRSAAA